MAADDGFAIALPYGSRASWLQDELASGSASIVNEGAYRIDQANRVRQVEPVGTGEPARTEAVALPTGVERADARRMRIPIAEQVGRACHAKQTAPSTTAMQTQMMVRIASFERVPVRRAGRRSTGGCHPAGSRAPGKSTPGW